MEVEEFRRAVKDAGFSDQQAEALALLRYALVNGTGRLDTQRIIAHLWTGVGVIVAALWLL